MLHLQLDVAMMNGVRQEHYMFDPGFSWPLSFSVKSVSRKVSVYEATCGHGITGNDTVERVCVSGLELKNDM